MSDRRVPGRRAPLEDANVRAAGQGTVDASGVGPSGRYRLRCVVASSSQPARVPAVLASAVVDDDPRLGEADQGILRVWAVMVGPVPWIAGFCQECLTGQRSPFPFTAAVPVTW